MDTKDVLTLILSGLAFLVSLGSYRISRRSALLAERTAARAEEKDKQAARVAAVVQKNDIIKEYQSMMIALNEVRWYYEVLRQMPLAHEKEDEIKRGMDAREMTVGLIKLHQSDAEALDPQRMSPEMLEEQRGKAQKLKLQVAGMLEGVKRADAHLKEAIAQSRQKPQPS